MRLADIKLAFREDKEANVVRCFVSSLDDTERTEVATIASNMLRSTPGSFEAWIDLMKRMFEATLRESGAGEVERWGEPARPHDKN